MVNRNWGLKAIGAAVMALALGGMPIASAQEPAQQDTTQQQQSDMQTDQPRVLSQDRIPPERGATVPMTQKADGQRRADLPLEAYSDARYKISGQAGRRLEHEQYAGEKAIQ